MKKHHILKNILIEDGVLSMTVDTREVSISLKDISPIFASASETELQQYEVSPSGYGIHWPLLDEDVSIDGLLGVKHTPDTKRKTA
jgi:hypothetical protein